MDFAFTNHLRQRYCERFRREKANLNDPRDRSLVNSELKALLNESSETRAFLTNTNFLNYLYRRYGYDRHFSVRENGKMIFVIIHDKGKNIVTTCMPRDGWDQREADRKFEDEKECARLRRDRIHQRRISRIVRK